jgi:arylsulfatase A-like enzyme
MPKRIKLIKKYLLIFLVVFSIIFIIGFYYYNKNIAENSIIPECTDCNVILIDLDTVRADSLGCYGYSRDTSPNIDELAKDGVIFKNVFSQSSYSLTSIMSIFTSLYPTSHQMNKPQIDKLNPDILTLAQILKFYNYTTVWIGPFEDQNLPIDYGAGKGFENFYYERTSSFDPKVIYWTDALNWLESNGNKTKFFMFMHTYRSHAPYVPTDDIIKKFINKTNPRIVSSYEEIIENTMKNINDNPSLIFTNETIKKNSEIFNMNYSYEKELKMFELTKDNKNLHKTLWDYMTNDIFFGNVNFSNPEDMAYIKILYDSTIFESDLDVKNVVEKINEIGVLNKTIIIITSSHGEEFLDHGKIGHAKTLYDETIKVPLIFSIPKIKLNKPVENLVQDVDIMPTILDLLNITTPAQTQGISLLPIIENTKDALHNEYVYCELNQSYSSSDIVSIRSKEWKFIIDLTKNKSELYDLINDPNETTNLIAIRKDVAQTFEKELQRYLNMEKFTHVTEIPQWMSNETRAKIEKEGYW